MVAYSWHDLNETAMQIILHAGDARKLIFDAMDLLCKEEDPEEIKGKLKQAKELLIKAHTIQSQLIQNSVEDENQKNCLLFNHAQDTLMIVQSEHFMIKNLLKLVEQLRKEIRNAKKQ